MLRNYGRRFSVERVLLPLRRFCTENDKPEGWDDAKPYEMIPGYKPLPLIGNGWRYLFGEFRDGQFVKIQAKTHKEFGDVVILRKQAPLPDMVTVYNPKDIELLIRNEGVHPVREGLISIGYYRNNTRRDIFGDIQGLLTTQGKAWHEVRSKVNPVLLQPRTAKKYITPIDDVSADFIQNIKKLAKRHPRGELSDFLQELNKWAFESIGVIALDRRFGVLDEKPNEDVKRMIEYMVETFKLSAILDFTPMGHVSRLLNLAKWKTFVKYMDYFTNMTMKHLDEAEERIRNSRDYDKMAYHEKSAFEKLLMVDKKIAIIMTLDMLTAGIDTTGKVSGAALYFLAKNTEKQEILRKEVMAAIPTPDTPITQEILEKVPYVRACIKETTRLAPIGSSHLRASTKNMVLGGYQIPKGTTILVPTLYLSTREQYYPRPNEFIPERWLNTTTNELSHKNAGPFITMPFGHGPRACVGKRFANLEMEIFLVKMMRNFKIEWPHKDMTFGQELLYGIQDPLNIRVREIN